MTDRPVPSWMVDAVRSAGEESKQPPLPEEPRLAGAILIGALSLLRRRWGRMMALGLILALSAVALVFPLGIAGYMVRWWWPSVFMLMQPVVGLLLVPLSVGYQWCVLRLAGGWRVQSGDLFRAFQRGQKFWRVMIAGSVMTLPYVVVEIAGVAAGAAAFKGGVSVRLSHELAWLAFKTGLMFVTIPFSWAGLHAIATAAPAGLAIRRSLGWAWRYRGLSATYLGASLAVAVMSFPMSVPWGGALAWALPGLQGQHREILLVVLSGATGILSFALAVAAGLFSVAVLVGIYDEFNRRDQAASAPRAA